MHEFVPFLPLAGSLLALFEPVRLFPLGPSLAIDRELADLQDQRRLHRPGGAEGHRRVGTPADEPPGRTAVRPLFLERDRALARTVTETYTDKDGNTQTRTRRKAVEPGGPGGRDDPLLPARRLRRACSFCPQGPGAGADVRRDLWPRRRPVLRQGAPRRSVRFRSPPPLQRARHSARDDALVVGQARERQDVVAAEIAATAAPLFLISTRFRSSK